MFRKFAPILALVLLFSTVYAAETDKPAPEKAALPTFDPAATKVAILPVVNNTGKDTDENRRLVTVTQEAIAKAFSDRGFQLLLSEPIKTYLADKKVDLAKEDSRAKDALVNVGKDLGARLVVCGMLHSIENKRETKLFSNKKIKVATVQMKVVDTETAAYLVDGKFEGKQKSGWIFGGDLDKSADLRDKAVLSAVSDSLEELLKPYKVLPKEKKEGETAPGEKP